MTPNWSDCGSVSYIPTIPLIPATVSRSISASRTNACSPSLPRRNASSSRVSAAALSDSNRVWLRRLIISCTLSDQRAPWLEVMLSPAQVVPFLQHADQRVRNLAVKYLSGANDPSPATADDIWRMIDKHGPGEYAFVSYDA